MFQTKVPVVEPKSTKVTVPLKGGFGRVEDILFGEERLQVELATYLYQRDKAIYTKHLDEIKKMIVDRPRRVGQKMIRPSATVTCRRQQRSRLRVDQTLSHKRQPKASAVSSKPSRGWNSDSRRHSQLSLTRPRSV